jgi:peptidoglycan/LPS O-acetylase OafA/YrhL
MGGNMSDTIERSGAAAGLATRIAVPRIAGHGASAAQPTGVARDSSVDAIRVVLLVMVFALHAMMVGVSVGADGPLLQNALEGQAWFAPVSWIVQIMPLFFIAGGFSSIHHWRAMRARGDSPADYVRARLERLVRPAIALVVVVAGALVALSMAGLAPELVATAGFRIGQPLWFLGVYLATSALVPLMVRAHERARVLTPIALLAGVVAVDVLRFSTGIDAIGFVNLLLVWLLVQQLGFQLADGGVDRLSRRTLWSIAGASLALLAVLTVAGPYPVDMLVNLNPPTVCLVVLGIAQLALFQLARPAISAWVERVDASRLISAVGARAMTIYLWHLPVLILLAGLALLANAAFSLPLPTPLSLEWWATRPLWLSMAAAVVLPVALLFGRFELTRRAGDRGTTGLRGIRATAIDAACGVGGVAVLLVFGFAPIPAVVALLLLIVALRGTASFSRAIPLRAATTRATAA